MKDWQKHGKNIQSIGNSYFNTVEIFCCADKNSFVDWLIREEEDPSNIAAALKTRLLVAGHLDDHHMRIHVISKKLDEDKARLWLSELNLGDLKLHPKYKVFIHRIDTTNDIWELDNTILEDDWKY